MKTVIEVHSNLQDIANDDWAQLADREGYLPKTAAEREEILKELGFTEAQFEFINGAFAFARDQIVGALHSDLSDIWRRMDELEKRLAK